MGFMKLKSKDAFISSIFWMGIVVFFLNIELFCPTLEITTIDKIVLFIAETGFSVISYLAMACFVRENNIKWR